MSKSKVPYNPQRGEYGDKAELKVLDRLHEYGISAIRPPKANELPEYSFSQHQNDILALGINHFCVVEVKRRTLKAKFNNPKDYPYCTVFVDKVLTYAAKVYKPKFNIICNASLTAAIVIPAESEKHWTTKWAWINGQEAEVYECPRQHCITFAEFKSRLKAYLDADITSALGKLPEENILHLSQAIPYAANLTLFHKRLISRRRIA